MNVYEIVTQRIIEKLEKGIVPWVQGWSDAQNYKTKHVYTGINMLLLSNEGTYFLTYKQAQDLGGQVKKGAKGLPVVFMSTFKKKDNEDDKSKTISFLKYHTVFKIEDIDGITVELYNPIKYEAESVINNFANCPKIIHIGSQPCYIPSSDTIEIPDKKYFKSSEYYYGTLFHEIGHSTGHDKRLNRKLKGKDNIKSYSKEELTAELTSAFLYQYCGINKPIDNTTSYIYNWLKVLKNDKTILVQSASQAQKACDYILQKTKVGDTIEV